MALDIFRPRERALLRIEARVRKAGHLFLFLDYDGTLVGLRKTPRQAVPSVRLRRLLDRLQKLRATTLGVITGRSLTDITALLKPTKIVIAANHGFEIVADGKTWIHPGVSKRVADLLPLSTAIRRKLRKVPGVLVEYKKSTLSVHYRNVAPSSVDRVRSVVEAAVSPLRRNLVLTNGKKVIEIRPKVAWSKGHAVRRLVRQRRWLHNPLVVYCGDDVTDEDAFRLLSKKAVTIRVGNARLSRARYTVENVSAMHRFLSLVCDWRTGSGKTANVRNRPRNQVVSGRVVRRPEV